MRLLQLDPPRDDLQLLSAVFHEEARSIGAVSFIPGLTLTISASLMHMIEDEAQLDGFSSFPTMGWATERLTAVPYGDRVPATITGEIIGGGVTAIGVAAARAVYLGQHGQFYG